LDQDAGCRDYGFRDSQDVRVLLSSEVGSEGIDLQFCHVLVNYDLPWNPCGEQRIGIDRVGQRPIGSSSFTSKFTHDRGTAIHPPSRKVVRFQNSIGDLEPSSVKIRTHRST
jgi:hypothetical protein